jgi:ethanolamine utilization microcompartment shell protein EutL
MARVRFLDQVPVGFYDVNNSNGGTPGGPSNSIQYNDGGTFNGDINLRWDNNTDTVLLTGSIIATSFTGSLFGTSSFAISASQARTASYVVTAQTASYVLSASYALSSSQAQTASYVVTAQTASYVLNAVSSSQAATASYVNPLNQNPYKINLH